MNTKTKRLSAVIIAFSMILTLLAFQPNAFAADASFGAGDEATFIAWCVDPTNDNFKAKLTGALTISDVGGADALTVGANVTIDLNGHNLTINQGGAGNGIKIAALKKLIITDSSTAKNGTLTVNNNFGGAAGINVNGAELEINSGNVIANGGVGGAFGGAGIGGSSSQTSGKITITGGKVTATGAADGTGIGGGNGSPADSITISGGEVIATGGDNAAGIGSSGAVVGGTIILNGGKIAATGGDNAAGIGGGNGGDGGTITVSGTADVTATGGDNGAGIGGGHLADGGTIILNGGKITATGGDNAAGIGGGNGGDGGTITVSGTADVTATGGVRGAGIGGGDDGGTSGTIVLNGGKITAQGGANAAGIGGGKDGAGDIIEISGTADVKATAGAGGAGIGGGLAADSGRIYIKDTAVVNATGGGAVAPAVGGGAGIGGGGGSGGLFPESAGNMGIPGLTISGSAKVTATGKDNAAGIGGGGHNHATMSAGDGGQIDIEGTATVIATGDGLGAGIGGGGNADAPAGAPAGAGPTLTIDAGASVTVTGGATSPGAIGSGFNGATPPEPSANLGTTTIANGANLTLSDPIGNAPLAVPIITTGNPKDILPFGEVFNYHLDTVGGALGTGGNVTLHSGKLPNGLIIVRNGIQGTPLESGSFTFVLKVTDSAGTYTYKTFSLKVSKELPTGALPDDAKITVPADTAGASGIRDGLIVPGLGKANGVNATATNKPIIKGVESKILKDGRTKVFVTVENSSDMYFQWQVKNETGEWEDIFGAVSSTYVLYKPMKLGEENEFRCVVRNGVGKEFPTEGVKATRTARNIEKETLKSDAKAK